MTQPIFKTTNAVMNGFSYATKILHCNNFFTGAKC